MRIVHYLNQFFGGKGGEEAALSPIDFAALAKGFGAAYVRAPGIAEVISAIGAVTEPTIIEMREGDYERGPTA